MNGNYVMYQRTWTISVKLLCAVTIFCETITAFEIDAFRIYQVATSFGNNQQKVASITDHDTGISRS
jgi:hypothetical protein